MRRFKRRIKRGVVFLAIIVAAAYVLTFLFRLREGIPNLRRPNVGVQEEMRKRDEAAKKATP